MKSNKPNPPVAAPIQELWATPAPARVIVIGKGPSLDEFDETRYPHDVLMALNEAALVLQPPSAYVCYLDHRMGEMKLDEKTSPIRKDAHKHHHGGRGYCCDDKCFGQHKDIAIASPVGTISMTLSVLGVWGVTQIMLVGFDGHDGYKEGDRVYARRLEGRILKPRRNANYTAINKRFNIALKTFPFDVAWFHRGEAWPYEDK